MSELPPIVTLTTDFGADSPYVAQMKAVLLAFNRQARLVDVTHSIAPQDVRQGARVLEDVSPWFPAGTIHVAVVDPGVGTERKIVYAQLGQQHYIAPDNGLLSLLARRFTPTRLIALTNPRYWQPEVSSTFHGRDIMAPVAAHLSLGLAADQLGEPLDQLVTLDWPPVRLEPGRLTGSVVWIDSFGNLISDITVEKLPAASGPLRVRCGGQETGELVRTYGQRPPASLVALLDSSGRLELAIVGGNAAHILDVSIGSPVEVLWNEC